MIFNLGEGGVSRIAVTAPDGATTTITNGDRTMTATGDHIFAVSVLGTWTVTCVYEGILKTVSVDIQGYGEAWMIEFVFSAYIVVRTSAGADVTASKTGEEDLTGTADENGICQLTVPLSGIGKWSIVCELDIWSRTATLTVPELDDIFTVDIPMPVPQFTFTPDGGSDYEIDEDTNSFNNSNMRYIREVDGWYLYLFKSGVLTVPAYLLTDVFVISAGNIATNAGGSSGPYNEGGKYETYSDHMLHGDVPIKIGMTQGTGRTYADRGYGDATEVGDLTTETSIKCRRLGASKSVYAFEDSTVPGPTGIVGYKFGGYGGWGGYIAGGTDDRTASGGSGDTTHGGGKGGSASMSNEVVSAADGYDATRYGASGGQGGAGWDTHGHHASGGTGNGYQGFAGLRST